MTSRTPTNRQAKTQANLSFGVRRSPSPPSTHEETDPNEAVPTATSTPGSALGTGNVGPAVADPRHKTARTPPKAPTHVPPPARDPTPPPAPAPGPAPGPAHGPPVAPAPGTGPTAPPGRTPTAGVATWTVNKKEKDRLAVLIRANKGALTRRLGKAKDLRRIVDARPPPSINLLNSLQAARQAIVEVLDKLDDLYCDISIADMNNTQSYLDKGEEQHLRAQKDLDELQTVIMQTEILLRDKGISLNGSALHTPTTAPAAPAPVGGAAHPAAPGLAVGAPGGPGGSDGSDEDSESDGGHRPLGHGRPRGGPPPGPPSSGPHSFGGPGSTVSNRSTVAPPPRADGVPLPTRVNHTLKPNVLTRDATPVEFCTFMRKFTAYYKTSNMHLVPLDVQREYFANCIEPTLYEKIEQGFTPTTQILPKVTEPVFGAPHAVVDHDPSAFQLLYDAFMRRFPLVTRRFNLFKYKPSQGQSFTDWTKRLHKQAAECDIHLMTEDDIFVMMYLAGVQNQRLSEELHKLQNPTTETLYAAAEAWEIAQNQKKLIDNGSSSRANFAHSQTKGGNRGNSNPQGQSQRPNLSQRNANPPRHQQAQQPPRHSAFRCFRCGSKNESHTCAAIDAICKFCNKKGHFKGVCNARAKAEQTGGTLKTKARQATVTGPANPSLAQQASSQ